MSPKSKLNSNSYATTISRNNFKFFRFCQFLKLGSSDKILATVNVGNPVSRNAQKAIFRQWIEEDNQPKLKWNLDFD